MRMMRLSANPGYAERKGPDRRIRLSPNTNPLRTKNNVTAARPLKTKIHSGIQFCALGEPSTIIKEWNTATTTAATPRRASKRFAANWEIGDGDI